MNTRLGLTLINHVVGVFKKSKSGSSNKIGLYKKSKKSGSRGGWARFARKKGLDEHTFTFDSHKSCNWYFKKR